MFSTSIRRFASSARAYSSAKSTAYISSFLLVPVTYVVLNETSSDPDSPSLLAQFKPTFNANVAADALDADALGHAWSWPWSSAKSDSASANAHTSTKSTATTSDSSKNSGKVFVRTLLFSESIRRGD